jgi:hypothetical protein
MISLKEPDIKIQQVKQITSALRIVYLVYADIEGL